ncbi:MAG: discoidin domain-containing protein [Planctomycetota bacterium]
MRTEAALLVLVFALPCLAGDNPNAPIEYPKEWGADLCAADAGAKVVETSSNATAPEALLDGWANEGHQWEPSWSRGLPASFTIKLPAASKFNKLVFTTRTSGEGYARECELWVGKSLSEMRCERSFGLPQKSVQIADFEAVEALYVRVVIKSSWKDEELEVGEAALFFHGAAPPRGSDTRDSIDLKVGDRLLGDVLDEEWKLKTRFGELAVKRADLTGLSLSEDGDRVFFKTGEIVSGELSLQAARVRLDSGQTVEVARSKVSSIGMRKGSVEFPQRTEELLARGSVFTIGEERWLGKLEASSLTLQTTVGSITLAADTILNLELGQGGEPLDRVTLRNGDLLRGILVEQELGLKLALGPRVTVSKAQVARIALALEGDGATASAPENQRVLLKTGDVVSGSLAGDKLKIRTSYATIELELTALDRLEAQAGGKLKAFLRDGSFVVGRPVPDVLVLDLDTGSTTGSSKARIPVDRIAVLENWRLPVDLAAKVDAFVKKLDDASWPVREAAKGELVKLGKLSIPRVTKALRTGSAEAKKNAGEVLALLKDNSTQPAVREEK